MPRHLWLLVLTLALHSAASYALSKPGSHHKSQVLPLKRQELVLVQIPVVGWHLLHLHLMSPALPPGRPEMY